MSLKEMQHQWRNMLKYAQRDTKPLQRGTKNEVRNEIDGSLSRVVDS